MKLLHCADLHLDSKMTSILDKERARERKAELLHTFQDMISYAVQNNIFHILIAGDLFDTGNISAGARKLVISEITGHPDIRFYYLRGNHDRDNFLSSMESIPDNLMLFSTEWTSYTLSDEGTNHPVVLSGIELAKGNSENVYNTLVLDSENINLVTLHGQEYETGTKDKAEIIRLRELQNKGIDYLALGHVHAYKRGKLDGRGIYCYPGCLEGRGFDECGQHGFVVLDIDEKKQTVSDTFVPFAKRQLYTVEVDVTGCGHSAEMAECIKKQLAEASCKKTDLIKVILTGALDVSSEKNINYLVQYFSGDFYFVKIYDETTLKVEPADYRNDESLKGEYVRTVLSAEDITEEEKASVIRLGLQILGNEEVLL